MTSSASAYFAFASDGTLRVFNDVYSTGGSFHTSLGSRYEMVGRGAWDSVADGNLIVKNIGLDRVATLQFGQTNFIKTANYAIGVMDCGIFFNNSGSSGATTNTLPAALSGRRCGGYVAAAQTLAFKAVGSDVIRKGTTVTSAAGICYDNAIGSEFELVCPVDGTWSVRLYNGTITLGP